MKSKINWKQKLTSRKFWAAIIGVVTSLGVIFGIPDITTQQIAGVITAVAALIAYIIGEGIVDAARASTTTEQTTTEITLT